jgi:ribosomal protein S18 acetylase RimI-like enzyme
VTLGRGPLGLHAQLSSDSTQSVAELDDEVGIDGALDDRESVVVDAAHVLIEPAVVECRDRHRNPLSLSGGPCKAPAVDPVLRNAVWHALIGPQRTVAERHGNAVRLQPDVGTFAALPDEPVRADWDDLRALVGPGNIAVLFRHAVDVAEDWEAVGGGPGVQMTSPRFEPFDDDRIAELGPNDVPEMLDLVRRTEPGPFFTRTIELGRYVGVRHEGALIAMAGERLHPGEWREVSAVCTDPAHRGKGLGSTLTRAVAADIQARGERAFLQAWAKNDAAIGLYETMGFTLSGTADVTLVRAPA